jgi:8-oxo-dGTP diphosphatase
MKQDRPQVGVGVIVRWEHKVLLGKRKSGHGSGSWSFPGGHLELGEQIEHCARREVEEETGAVVSIVCRGPYTNDIFHEERKHYVTLFVVADYISGDIEAQEPDKCERWEWFDWNDLPMPLFLPIQNLLKTGFVPFS